MHPRIGYSLGLLHRNSVDFQLEATGMRRENTIHTSCSLGCRWAGSLAPGALRSYFLGGLVMCRFLPTHGVLLATAVLLAGPLAAGAAATGFDCADRGATEAVVWPHPTCPQLVAVLCRHDPLPGWWDSLWIVQTRSGRSPLVLQVPLHGTGVDHFAWQDSPGAPLAHVIDRTHMGTVTDQLLRLDLGGRLQIVH